MKKIISAFLSSVILSLTVLNASAFTITNTYPLELKNVSTSYTSSSTIITFEITADAYVTVGIARQINSSTGEGELVKYLKHDAYTSMGTWSLSWDQKDENGDSITSDDVYYYWIKAYNDSNKLNPIQVTKSLDYATSSSSGKFIQDLEVFPYKFDPHSGEKTEISFELTRQAELTVKVYDHNDNHVYTIQKAKEFQADTFNLEWDGYDKNETIVDDDKYYIKVTATLGSGEVYTKEAEVEVEKGAHQPLGELRLSNVFTTKDSIDTARGERTYVIFTTSTETDATVTIYDSTQKIKDIYSKTNIDAGTYAAQWSGEDKTGKKLSDGTYTYKIHVENEDTEKEQTGKIYLANDDENSKYPNIYNDRTKPVLFEANGEDTLTFDYTLAEDADVSLSVYDNGSLIREVFNDSVKKGSREIEWTGADTDGYAVPVGVYDYRFVAENEKGESNEWGKLIVVKSTSGIIEEEQDVTPINNNNNDQNNEDNNNDNNNYNSNNSEKCAEFEDVFQDEDICEAAAWAKENLVFEGYADNTFRGDQPISRVEALKSILQAFDFPITNSDGTNLGFNDVEKYGWYMKYVKTGKKYGIISGYGDKSFKPGKKITKAEAVQMVMNAAETNGTIIPMCSSNPYKDVYTDDWYSDAACFVKKYALTSDVKYFNPDDLFTRAEMAELLYNFHKR